MIPLNTPRQLPPAAAWYWLVRSLFVCGALVLIAFLLQSGVGSATCRGALCGSSGRGVTAFLYLFAGVLAVRSIVNTLTCSFVLSDKSITINRGLLFRNSSTIRFDRIQDVRGSRGPLLSAFGLEAIALWTASPDQRVGNARRPDGQLVLNTADAEWLKQFLAEPSASATAESAPNRNADALSAPGARSPFVMASVLLVTAGLAVWGLLHFIHLSPSVAATTASRVPVPSVTSQMPVASPVASPPHIHEMPADSRMLKCSLPGSDGEASTIPCHEQAERCAHERDFASAPTAAPAALTLINRGTSSLQFYWLNRSGIRQAYGALTPGGRLTQPTHTGAHWLLATPQGQCVGIFDAATVTLNVAY